MITENCINMIIDFKVNYNDYEEQILINNNIFKYACPNCRAKHSLSRHAKYKRYIVFLYMGKMNTKKLVILRLICSSCNKTHAILPNDIVPYCVYTYSCMITVMFEHFVKDKSILCVSDEYQISFELIYYFINKLEAFLNDCVYVLRLLNGIKENIALSVRNILNIINIGSLKNIFQELFFNKTKWMILMKRFQNIWPKPITIGSTNSLF